MPAKKLTIGFAYRLDEEDKPLVAKAKSGNAQALVELGRALLDRDSNYFQCANKPVERALDCFTLAAAQGSGEGYLAAGQWVLDHEKHTPENLEKAVEYLKAAYADNPQEAHTELCQIWEIAEERVGMNLSSRFEFHAHDSVARDAKLTQEIFQFLYTEHQKKATGAALTLTTI
ncbi:MAG: hypothetical protein DI551_06690 [Micavibrio aeruginosavorus]|uniref:Sel1 repeat family protein n=1 Tax=Micavibrio aeruginosavorus TaxID=349221 RepID=A0A2W5MWM4_9BACT|nr:MAG: hypothetical protein DI551_06690 [Micavibrio aeruginosavorus]